MQIIKRMMSQTEKPLHFKSEKALLMEKTLRESGERKQGWDKLWQQGITNWNIGKPAPPLVEILSPEGALANQVFEKCFVPGCGEGHDVAMLGRRKGCKLSLGLDISELAIEKATKLHSATSPSHVKFISEDFFDFCKNNSDSPFDLVFDYTFLCALNPNLRHQWASSMSLLCKPETGILVTIMFPLAEFEGGPPYSLSSQVYEQLLKDKFELVHGPVVSEATVPNRAGREMIAAWRRK